MSITKDVSTWLVFQRGISWKCLFYLFARNWIRFKWEVDVQKKKRNSCVYVFYQLIIRHWEPPNVLNWNTHLHRFCDHFQLKKPVNLCTYTNQSFAVRVDRSTMYGNRSALYNLVSVSEWMCMFSFEELKIRMAESVCNAKIGFQKWHNPVKIKTWSELWC